MDALISVRDLHKSFSGRPVPCLAISSSPRNPSGVSMAEAIEPSPPASDTATASAGVLTPAIGASSSG